MLLFVESTSGWNGNQEEKNEMIRFYGENQVNEVLKWFKLFSIGFKAIANLMVNYEFCLILRQ